MEKIVRIACTGAELLPLSQLTVLQGNLKDLSTENFEKLRRSILELGFIEPFSAWKDPQGTVWIGNGTQRHRVLSHLIAAEGYQVPPVPVNWVEAADIQEFRRKLLSLASSFGMVTEQGLYEYMAESGLKFEEVKAQFSFHEVKFDHFEDNYFKDPVTSGGTGDPEDTPAVPKEAFTRRGDLFLLGAHRILCGDSTKPEDVERVMNGEQADLIFTDPPYGVGYVGKTEEKLTIENDSLNEAELLQFLKNAFGAWPLKPGGTFYVCSPAGNLELTFRLALPDLLRQCLVWVKQQFVMGRQDYHWRHESILYGWKDGAAHYFVDDRTQDTVWNFDRPKRSEEHPTMKPIELIEKAVLNSTRPAQNVFDGFMGSGSTLLACEKNGRKAFGIEVSPGYCDVILTRWAKYTGHDPIRESDGQPWSAICHQPVTT